MSKFVLSIDGGGIRGIIPALVLAEIERCSGKRISDIFDLIVGTSTGGVLAYGLATPDEFGNPKYSAWDLLTFYEKDSKEVFKKNFWRKIITLWGLIGTKYKPDVLIQKLKNTFGELKMTDMLTNVMVTSYDFERRSPYFFKVHKAHSNEQHDFPVWQAALATASAPTYFPPVKLETSKNNYLALTDGGVHSNNPAMSAYVEAKKLFPDDDIVLVSVGTGDSTMPYSFGSVKNWGIAKWAVPLLNIVFDGVADVVDYHLRKLFPEDDDKNKYFRFQIKLEKKYAEMDDASEKNIRALRLFGEKLIDNHRENIQELCEVIGVK